MDPHAKAQAQAAADIRSTLRRHGVFPTVQRLAIATELLSKPQHLTADGLDEALRRAGLRVAKATIYNTLKLFVERGLIREIVADPGHSYYDSNTSTHQHVYNVDSGELSDIPEPLSAQIAPLTLPEGTDLERIEVVVRVRNRRR